MARHSTHDGTVTLHLLRQTVSPHLQKSIFEASVQPLQYFGKLESPSLACGWRQILAMLEREASVDSNTWLHDKCNTSELPAGPFRLAVVLLPWQCSLFAKPCPKHAWFDKASAILDR
jgi:hypothetical protein|mmetsp:Transcript_13827/g.25037  ORF Transcript_13827/g.25037 Transcript_13827/m.25037 type:complete len:118 (+) Transcript_13827:236-589(+)